MKQNINLQITSELVCGNSSLTIPLTIGIPTFKRFEKLKFAVESALNQTLQGYELIIVDNDPEENSTIKDWLSSFKPSNVCYYRNTDNVGMVNNWNTIIALAKGKWVSILSDDDMLHPEFVSAMMALVDRFPLGNFFLSNIGHFREESRTSTKNNLAKNRGKSILHAELLNQNAILYGNVSCNLGSIFRRDYAIGIGGFDPSLYPSFDHIFAKEYVTKFPAGYRVSETFAYYLVEDNTSAKIETQVKFLEQDIHFYQKFICERANSNPFLLFQLLNKTVITLSKKQWNDELKNEVFCKLYPNKKFNKIIIIRNLIDKFLDLLFRISSKKTLVEY